MSKFEDVRIVTFKEDYGVPKVDKDGKPVMRDGKQDLVIYYKKSTGPKDKHAIHKNVVKKLQDNGAKMDVEEFDRKADVKKEKEKLLKRDKTQVSIERR